jgi:hypothetical protein
MRHVNQISPRQKFPNLKYLVHEIDIGPALFIKIVMTFTRYILNLKIEQRKSP